MSILLYDKPVRIELTGYELLVNDNGHARSVRTINQMASLLMGQVDIQMLQSPDMYYMYRDVYKHGSVRFDITVIPAQTVGQECAKTHGHYHPKSENGLAYPELYQVLHGKAVFILQKKNRNGSVDVSIVNAGEKDIVLLPAGYGHVTVNSGNEVLVLANLVYDRFSSIYHEYEQNHGAAYYYLQGGELVQNTNYIIEKNERVTPQELAKRYKFSCSDILGEFYANPEKFAFLEKPGLLFK